MKKGSHHTEESKRRLRLIYAQGHSLLECRKGHPRTPENVSTRPNGDTRCQVCERANKRLHRYGLDESAWKALFESQGRACAACGSKTTGSKDWHTDHNHTCCPAGRSCGNCVRGILCDRCNRALGNVDDSIEKLQTLIDYLKRTTNGCIDKTDYRYHKLGEETVLQP